MSETRDDVARTAVQLERDGRLFYLDAAEKAQTDLVRKMFESLADDELKHIEWIVKMLPDVDTASTANRQLYQRLSHIFADVPEAKLRSIAASESDVGAINTALGIEKKAVAAYEKWQDEAEGVDVKKLCNLLAGVERFHVQILNNTLEYFERTPDWFMQEEQWNFEGG
jgi:rubrerythrin